MPPYIVPSDDQALGDLAAELVSIAQAEGLPQPEVDTSGPELRFLVSDELYASYRGAPAASNLHKPAEPVPELAQESEEPKSASTGKTGKKRKGDN